MTLPPIISFDLDDTLYDNTPVIQRAFTVLYDYLCHHYPNITLQQADLNVFIQGAMESRLRYPDEVDFQRIRHLHITDCLKQAGYHDIDTDAAYRVFLDARQVVQLFDDVIPTLTTLSKNYRLVSISNGNAEPNKIGLGHLISGHFSPHDCGFAKPDPQMYQWVCNALGISASQLIHIGDCLNNDIKAAQDVGATAIWFNPKHHSGYAGLQINSISDLVELIPTLS